MKNVRVIISIVVMVLFVGCTGVQTFSNAARSGDTVSIAIGVTNGAEFIAKADVVAVLIDSNDVRHPVTVREVVRAYADPTSRAAFGILLVPPYEGQWMALVDLVDPVTQAPPSLATGLATLELSHPTAELYDPVLTILSGTGSPHPLHDATGLAPSTVEYLNALEHVAVQTAGSTSEIVAGATFTLLFDASTFDASFLTATKLSQDPNVQLISSLRDLGDGWLEMKVILLNPHGFDAENFADLWGGKSRLKDLWFVVAWANGVQHTTPTEFFLVSSEYIDIDGDAISTLTASFGGGFGYTIE